MNLGAVKENMIFGVLLVLLFFAWWKSSLRSAIVEGAWEGILEDYGNPGPALGVEGISPFLAGDTNNYHSFEHFIEDIMEDTTNLLPKSRSSSQLSSAL